jgi:hypothetical protein
VEDLRAEIGAAAELAVAALPRPRDGRDGTDGRTVSSEEVIHMVREEVEARFKLLPQARDGRDGRDGDPGRDAADLDVLPSIADGRSYPRGTFAAHSGGVVRAIRDTDPNAETLEEQGWQVVFDGVAALVVSLEDDGRTLVVSSVLTSGRRAVTRMSIPVPLYRGVHQAERTYDPGDSVTYDGSTWIAREKTTDRPGTSEAWQLSVKRGRDGRAEPRKTEAKPVRLR